MDFTVEVSARHVHLSQAHLIELFGENATLTVVKDLSQPGQFVSEERVDIISEKNTYENVAVLGPVRKNTQVEISLTDSYYLGIKAPVRESGDVSGSASVKIRGPLATIEIQEGLIVAKRHIHMTPEDAEKFKVKDKDIVTVKIPSLRKLYFADTVVRVNKAYALAMHIDLDEANAAGIGREEIRGSIVEVN
jgi:putative phosphotransacetylase